MSIFGHTYLADVNEMHGISGDHYLLIVHEKWWLKYFPTLIYLGFFGGKMGMADTKAPNPNQILPTG